MAKHGIRRVMAVSCSHGMSLNPAAAAEVFRIKAEPIVFPYRVAHVAWDYNFSIAKAREALGYQPKIDWRTGLSRTVLAYRNYKKTGVNDLWSADPPRDHSSG